MKLEAIRALIEAATPGPWAYRVIAANFYTINQDDHHPGHVLIDGVVRIEDAQFLAASRTLMPKLLAVAEAARFRIDHGGHSEFCKAITEWKRTKTPDCDDELCTCGETGLGAAITALEAE